MIEKSTLSGTSKRVADGGIAIRKGLGNGLMRAERTRATPSVVADGNRTRKKAEHMLVCVKRYGEYRLLCFRFQGYAWKFFIWRKKFMSVIFTLRW